MGNKLICTILLIFFIILLFHILNKYMLNSIILEKFASNGWTTDRDVLDMEKMPLNDVQKKEVEDTTKAISKSTLQELIASQSPLLTGPQGPPGIQGPSGTPLIASGRLVNKSGSFDYTKDNNNNYFNPNYVVTRTEGTNKNSSLSFMDTISPFASFQSWQLDTNNNLKNRYDNTCLTINNAQDKLYMDTCSDMPNQKWSWDNSNRLISTSASTSQMLKCVSLTKPELNVLTTNLPGCVGESCMNNKSRRYLVVKDCPINNMHDEEIWSFV